MGTHARHAKKDASEFDPLRDQVIRRHVEPRHHLFSPRDCDDCPVDHKFLSAQRITIAQFKDGTFDADVSWDWSSRDGQRVMKGEWMVQMKLTMVLSPARLGMRSLTHVM